MNETLKQIEDIVIGTVSWDSDYAMPLCSKHNIGNKLENKERKQIFQLATELYIQNKPIDIDILAIAYEQKYQLSIKKQLLHCETQVTTVQHLEYYLDLLDLKYLQRQAETNMKRTADFMGKSDPVDIKNTIAKIQQSWIQFSLKEGTSVPELSLYEIGENLLKEWQTPLEKETSKLHWPYRRLDQSLGWLDNEFVILAGRPGAGKTSLALAMCLTQAYAGIQTAMASLESKKPPMVERLIAMISGVSTWELKRKNLYGIDEAKSAVEKLKELPIHIADNGMTLEQLGMWGHIEKEKGAQLLIIDNTRHIRPSRKYNSNVDQYADISLNVKFLRDDLNIPIILLHHLSREMKLSWSDAIERDGDIILFMIEDKDAKQPACQENHWHGIDRIDIEVRKNRQGHSGITDQMNFLLWKQVFEEI